MISKTSIILLEKIGKDVKRDTMYPLLKTITKSEKKTLCNPKVYILLVTMLLQIGICVWVGQLQLKSNEIKQYLLDLQNHSHLKIDVDAGQLKVSKIIGNISAQMVHEKIVS